MAPTDKEMKNLITAAHAGLKGAKSKKDIRAVFNDEEVGFLVLGYKKLSRLMLGWTVEEVIAGNRREKKDD